MAQRRRHVQILTLERRLADEANQLRAEAKKLPPGSTREVLLRKAPERDGRAYLRAAVIPRFETANLKAVIFSDREQVPVV